MKRREPVEVMLEIKNEMPWFDKEELLEYAKWSVQKLYNSLKNEEKLVIKCKPELINKLNKQRDKYRINEDIDHISIQYVELFDNIKKENEIYIQVYLSIYFYDDVQNNVDKYIINDKYWNDIWIVTYKECSKLHRKDSNCVNCGAVMQYNQLRDILECKYCGNIINNKFDSKWEIVDIELEK